MLNRELYLVNPEDRKIVNEGVASVNDIKLNVLRYELETFVCDGQYEKGIEHILDTYLRNLRQEQQPAVWVSGFYGSGKSHLVKMLTAFWNDTQLQDGSTARGVAALPDNIKTLLIELSTQAKRMGGLHAASGTLGAGASGSVRLALLNIIFKSVNLPQNYSVARFVMWLKSENILDEVMKLVFSKGYDWEEELDYFYVAEGLQEALMEIKPHIFPSRESCINTLNNEYPNVLDISNEQMVKAIIEALSVNGQFPLSLIVLDEVQQFIGEDSQRAHEVQEVVEACCKQIGSKLLFIGTGQTAVTGTPNLKKLEGRFTVRIELSDADVEAVVRKVILAKKPTAISEINTVMERNIGEISRHLNTTSIGHNQKDIMYFIQDYPILPVRRRFWENTLRVLDGTGTDSQLRNQLSMVHKAAKSNIDKNIGNVIPADYLYFDLADKLLQARKLPRKAHERTMSWISQGEDEKLMARACGLVFLINQLSGSNHEVGIKSDADTLADLMVTDLTEGSSSLRSKLPALLDNCELLMKIKDEYRIQTEENIAWLDEFESQKSILNNENHRISSEREDRIKKKFAEQVGKISITQGLSKVTRDIYPLFDANLPADSKEKIYIWIRNGWNIDEESVRVEAKQAGNNSPTIFVFIPKRSSDELRHYIIDFKAAIATISNKGVPTTPEGQEAFSAMNTLKENAERNINELLNEAFSGAKVIQAGGNEILSVSLKDAIIESSNNALVRLYSDFLISDHTKWGKVYDKAKEGSPDSLKNVDYMGEPADNPVCKKVMNYIGSGKRGTDIRKNFQNTPFGWSGDAIDGALQALLVSGQLKALNESGKGIEPKDLERKNIGKSLFKVESITVSVIQRIQIRKVYQKLGIVAEQGKEVLKANEFIDKLVELTKETGGEEPKPTIINSSILNEIKQKSGNEQLLLIFANSKELIELIDKCQNIASKIAERIPCWRKLQELIRESTENESIKDIIDQVEVIKQGRLLLHEPDMIIPLSRNLETELRNLLNDEINKFLNTYNDLQNKLKVSSVWNSLMEEKQEHILVQCNIRELSPITISTYDELLSALKQFPIKSWQDKRESLATKFSRAIELANKELEPKIQSIEIPKRTMKSSADIDFWLKEVESKLKNALNDGPIIIK
ncbi:BREX system P-loop protein BrxC [Clostridium algidicarnis]|uniref:BREX system P-loop protein BrxC n=1 Tax=Clostridium algidicarnis TaxID=37659 RepID=UPI000495AD23|nr:BREX system P-loop protein BrxC [Clostridium algidicarnis]